VYQCQLFTVKSTLLEAKIRFMSNLFLFHCRLGKINMAGTYIHLNRHCFRFVELLSFYDLCIVSRINSLNVILSSLNKFAWQATGAITGNFATCWLVVRRLTRTITVQHEVALACTGRLSQSRCNGQVHIELSS